MQCQGPSEARQDEAGFQNIGATPGSIQTGCGWQGPSEVKFFLSVQSSLSKSFY